MQGANAQAPRTAYATFEATRWAASAVSVLFHVSNLSRIKDGLTGPPFGTSAMELAISALAIASVPILFSISGFLVGARADASVPLMENAKARWRRLFPLVGASALLACATGSFRAETGGIDVRALVLWLGMGANLAVDNARFLGNAMCSPAWAILVDLHANVLMLYPMRRCNPTVTAWAMLACVCVSVRVAVVHHDWCVLSSPPNDTPARDALGYAYRAIYGREPRTVTSRVVGCAHLTVQTHTSRSLHYDYFFTASRLTPFAIGATFGRIQRVGLRVPVALSHMGAVAGAAIVVGMVACMTELTPSRTDRLAGGLVLDVVIPVCFQIATYAHHHRRGPRVPAVLAWVNVLHVPLLCAVWRVAHDHLCTRLALVSVASVTLGAFCERFVAPFFRRPS